MTLAGVRLLNVDLEFRVPGLSLQAECVGLCFRPLLATHGNGLRKSSDGVGTLLHGQMSAMPWGHDLKDFC